MVKEVFKVRGKIATFAMLRWTIPAVAVLLVGIGLPVSAQTSVPDSDKAVLAARVLQLEQTLAGVQAQLDAIKSSLNGSASPASGQQAAASSTPQHGAPASAPGLTTPSVKAVDPEAVAGLTRGETLPTDINKTHRFFERKPGKDLTFYTHAGELTTYGNLDVSFDVMTKGIRDLRDGNGLPPVGNGGWLPDLSTNLSYVGIRGTQATGLKGLDFVYQLETQIDISSTSGTAESNSSESNQVKGGLTSRNSYIGLGSPRFGAIVFGKTDAPYKQSTARLNPFFAMIGDYQVIMGNTGGDNRVEFGTRLDHSIWYTSKRLDGLEVNMLFSPGQNRSSTSDNIAAGESDCTGIDIPGSGGSLPYACNDGAFSDAVSASVSYTKEPLYLVAAYERHMKVNRQSDLTGLYASVPPSYYAASVADEDAAKLGAQYTFAGKTTVSAIYEMMHRYVPDFLEFQNERQRSGSWLSLTQVISAEDSISMGWGRAYRTPGDPGQHNTSLELPPLGSPGDATGGRGKDNSANLYTVAYRHRLAGGLTAYFDWAATFNGPYAHYDLGAGGRGVTADCHDASDATGGESSDPHCWAGGHLKGVSAGLDKRF
ncbi:putative porin [Granulicella aggregans]|uniref:Putative porin n=1 Tax=Granulicella aggregans TaxID=474949 RepID=A0A7W8E6D2_9BACT|nr:porin [Granulicella aggregans]MBB5059135.1 putative porin [Granulicella aggregans]